MPQVRVREKHQVTLPMAIVRGANIHENDLLEVSYKNGVITLTTQQAAAPKRSLMDFVGITQGLYGKNAKQVAQYLDDERNSWER